MSNTKLTDPLGDLLAALPEIYQPIYGHPEHSSSVARECEDRLNFVAMVYRGLENHLGGPLRVLDLGSSQGFFSISLAQLGATVVGVDLLEANSAVSRALALEHPQLNLDFHTARIEHVLPQIQPDQFDLVLGLSVFHHLTHELGVSAVEQLLSALAPKIRAALFELALASEPLYWAPAQPADPASILAGFHFVHELAQSGTHLSGVTRPLYFASNYCWYLNEQTGNFDTWTSDSHALARGTHRGTRRYFFGGGRVAKLVQLNQSDRDAVNVHEHLAETAFLLNPPADFDAPRLLLHGRHERQLWLVRQAFPGELLLDKMRSDSPFDPWSVFRDVLAELAALERAGLYHSDLRVWNVLIGEPDGRCRLIDYGAIGAEPRDCLPPSDIFLNFFIFVHETLTGVIEEPVSARAQNASPYQLPQPYRNWALAFWAQSEAKRSFKLIADLFAQCCPRDPSLPQGDAQPPLWLTAQTQALRGTLTDAQTRIAQLQAEAASLTGELTAANERIAQLQTQRTNPAQLDGPNLTPPAPAGNVARLGQTHPA